MADPEDPDPPNEGGAQNADSTPEIPGVGASFGPEAPVAGEPAAPPPTHAVTLPEASEPAPEAHFDERAQSREIDEEAPTPPEEPEALWEIGPDARAVESAPEEAPPAAIDAVAPPPGAMPDHEPALTSLEPEEALSATHDADETEPAALPPALAAFVAAPEEEQDAYEAEVSPPDTEQGAADALAFSSVLNTPERAAEPTDAPESAAVVEPPQEPLTGAASVLDEISQAPPEPEQAIVPDAAAFDVQPGDIADEYAAEIAPAADASLFVEEPPPEAALFPATPAQDEAALFTAGLEAAPDVVAEIIPYRAPTEPPALSPPALSEESREGSPPNASRAPEDLAAPPLDEQPPALSAAAAWIAATTHAALSWVRARLPKGPERPATPATPARRRTFWPSPTRAPDTRPPGFRPSVRKILIMSGWATVGITAVVAGFFIYLTRDMPSTRSLWSADNSPSLTFVDRRNRVIIREGAESAPAIDMTRLPPYVPQAMIAIEDRRFYEHFGIDISGLMRAAASNVKAGHVVQGGSTITQQLAKNLFLSNSRTFQRKVQEVALALWLESQFSKRDILALYMSRVYFGAGAYGIEAAAERYFDKPAKDLTLPEAALLAGLVKAPSKLNPAAQDAAAKARAKIVLDEMLSAGFITAKAHQAALKAPLSISRSNPNGNLGYFRDWIDPQLNQVLGDQRDDFIIETTLDLDAQRAAEATLERIIAREKKPRNVTQGAILAMDSSGGVTTMVGGLNYGKGPGQSEFNRTTQSLRAPGSSFKYFIYMTAMAKGMSPWDVYVDKPVVYGDWAPGNYEDKYYGPVSLSSAYAKSMNMVAIQLANDVSGAAVIATAKSLGVGKRLQDYRSLGLGAQGMTVMEMVTGYGAMASGGYPVEPHGIERVRRANGQVMWARRSAPPRLAIDDRTMRMMNYLGAAVVRAGTGTRAQIPGRDIAGKTGTSNDYRDAWFIAYVPGMVAGVWLGNDNNTSMTKVTGGLLAAEVWHDFMVVALRETPIQQLAMPEIVEEPPPEEAGEVTETPSPSMVAVPPLATPTPAPDAPPIITPVGNGDG